MILRFREFGKTPEKTRTVWLKIVNREIIQALGNKYLCDTFVPKSKSFFYPEERVWALNMLLNGRGKIDYVKSNGDIKCQEE